MSWISCWNTSHRMGTCFNKRQQRLREVMAAKLVVSYQYAYVAKVVQ